MRMITSQAVPRTAWRRAIWGVLHGAVAAAAIAAPPPDKVALTNVRIIPIVGDAIDKGTILIEKSRITAVGKSVDVPYDARVYDLSGKVVMPGLIDASTSRGMDFSNEARPVTPQLDAADSIDPSSIYFEDSLRLGHTVLHVIPGDNTVIGGLGRIIRPIGLTPTEMTLAEGAFLKLSASPRGGFDRMVQMASLRETFAELPDYMDRLAEKRYEDKLKDDKKDIDVGPAEARKRGRDLIRAEDPDEEHRNILRLLGGQVKVLGEPGPTLYKPLGAFIACNSATDVGAAVRIAKEFGFLDRTVLTLGGDAFKAVAELKTAARPVVLTGDMLHRETDPLTGKVTETFVPKRIADAGLLYSLTPGSDLSMPERMLTYQAARCVREGVSRGDALKAITINAAKILGIDDRFGSIESGKSAHLVVYSGDPLDFNSVVEKVFVEGILAYEREKDIRIQRLLSTEERPSSDPRPRENQK